MEDQPAGRPLSQLQRAIKAPPLVAGPVLVACGLVGGRGSGLWDRLPLAWASALAGARRDSKSVVVSAMRHGEVVQYTACAAHRHTSSRAAPRENAASSEHLEVGDSARLTKDDGGGCQRCGKRILQKKRACVVRHHPRRSSNAALSASHLSHAARIATFVFRHAR